MCNTQFKAKSSAYKASLKYIISNPQTSHINMQHHYCPVKVDK